MLILGVKLQGKVIMTVPPSAEPTEITVIYVRGKSDGDAIRIGFDAPREVVIVREELIANCEEKSCSQ